MNQWIPFWPDTAANTAIPVNNLFIAEVTLSGVIMASVVAMMLTFCVRYRRNGNATRANMVHSTWRFEIGWTTATLALFLVLFVYGAGVYVWLYQAPRGDEEIYVVGKRWMWKIEHAGGQREINAMHVPVNKTIRLALASEDVIHSFSVPAFRIKHDIVPGTLEALWFKPNKTGTYLIACTQYCGLLHSKMQGQVVVMSQPSYARWLTEQGYNQTLAEQGAVVYRAHGCSGCHEPNSTVHAPSLVGLFGTMVNLQDGTVRLADETYIRDCILRPRTFNVAGYPPLMPDFSGQFSEGDLLKLVAYIKSIGTAQETFQ